MIDRPIPYPELKKLVGGTSVDDVILRLERQKIAYLRGPRDKPWTTLFAINSAMGLTFTTAPSKTPDVEID